MRQPKNSSNMTGPDGTPRQKSGLLAAGGVAGALLAASCCVVPFALISLGVTGAWIGQLSSLEPYKPYFLAITLVFLGMGFWHVYFKKPTNCEEGSYCARPQSSVITKLALWFGVVMAALAASVNYWIRWLS